jgi:small subunit ribosomal protein S6
VALSGSAKCDKVSRHQTLLRETELCPKGVKELNPYEICLILQPTLTPEEADQSADKVQEILRNNGGEVIKIDRWGKRRLAFPIQKQNDGFYFIINLKADSTCMTETKRLIKLMPETLRFMAIRQ